MGRAAPILCPPARRDGRGRLGCYTGDLAQGVQGNVIEQSELNTRENLLQIEYRLAELTDRMKTERPLPPTSQA
jgi:hypothetical protein